MLISNRILLTLAIISLLFFTISCKNEKSPLDEFANVKTLDLSGNEVHLNSDTILSLPYAFRVFDSLALFTDNVGKTGCTIVNLKTGKLLKRFAFAGDKSSEFNLSAISINSAINNKSVFTVLQLNEPYKIFRYNLDSLLHNAVYKPEPFYYFKDFGYTNSFLLNDSTLFGQLSFSKFDNKMFGITNISSNKLITGIDVPKIDDKSLRNYYEDSLYYNLMKGLLDVKVRVRPGSNFEFASFSRMGAIIQIFDIDKDYNFKVKYEKAYYLPSFTIMRLPGLNKPKFLPGSKYAFMDITVTKEKIYALFNGPDLTNFREFCDDVLVYDWGGKPLEKIKLDKKCRSISIDENNPKILYGLYGSPDGNSTSIHIVKYKLP